ncbi:GntR family transcriptional regulator [Saccharopolyspora sp. K220]|uniref:GntR family transcriptional regulator n=1 Tax=Saccharopolyspora soli TaxID=2926618 RepID=UPI001F56EDD9|nr:GntR family transcriptional regulator [Saccharopolyspora soli]MCI2419264.1 GntR family transcriptional regulator [Saccharopolyspora soli]
MAEKETRNERVYTGMRADILGGRWKPGQPLRIAELCEQFDSSVGVVRESLLRLADRGLVDVRPMQGFRVSTLSNEDLDDLTEARIDIETLALRYSIQQGDTAWESRLVGAHYLLTATPRHESDERAARFTAEWGKAHGAFHTALLEGCRNGYILATALRLRDRGELYRRWSVEVHPHDGRDLEHEHQVLLDAVLARDTDTAVARLAEHIRATHETLRKGLRSL